MIIVKVKGGLGNQLFILALCKKLELLGKNVKIDKCIYDEECEDRELSKIALNFEVASLEEIKELCDYKAGIFPSIKRYLGLRRRTHIVESNSYMESIFNINNAYLDGYWQNEKYFSNIRNALCELFVFQNLLKEDEHYFEEIKGCEAVSVHIRRGDYLELDKIYGNICTIGYYEQAIDKIRECVTNPKFFFFSDDMEWVRENFVNEEYIYVNLKEKKPESDLYLMSMCKHNIIANSSFSWWGAWLNRNRDKIVIAPSKWTNSSVYSPVCDDWIRI